MVDEQQENGVMTVDGEPISSELVWFEGRDLEVRPADWLAAQAIRRRVFVNEQSWTLEEEFDGHDARSRHVLMVEHAPGDAPREIGTARWRTVDWQGASAAKLERFAVDRSRRGGGVGRRLVEAVLEDARAFGHSRFVLHSQEYLVDFYRAFGFITVGERFVEAGTRHRRMVRED